MQAVDYAERVTSPGFVFMNTPGYDPASLSGLAAGGVNVIAFTTGRGSAIGFPDQCRSMKIASNSAMYDRMQDNMDVNAGRIADGECDSSAGRPRDLRHGSASRFRRADLRRTPRAQGICAVAHRTDALDDGTCQKPCRRW